ncbi:metalloregulator ArsR/SmtB family transcription factor [Arthrobacter sp. ISL-30]|uniref:ArsR/SmtB family transcription factor n=1 Tax=Arthrobacter sp. ISL-30 TaxID=2819109 RepID=UPI001BE732B6|nr:metalloregulator ArsR/SmtB family transcription factor [Arthrobacter sp. ISL-30]MBT2515659.1 metalloregulator ArsR/SmtB family transcription factor [Arthrobacter sp. ISL-30]
MSTRESLNAVFKALADPTRRLMLDRLRERNGQTLGELCEHLDMARQSVTQHLDLLQEANLVAVVHRGRQRLHYLNPTPIHEIQQRWIAGFDQPRLDALAAIKNTAEENAMTTASETIPTYVYVTYIRASAQQVWEALTDADLTAQYWHHANVSDWQPGSRWEHRELDGSGNYKVHGRVLESDPPRRLSYTFEFTDTDPQSTDPSVVTFQIEPHEDIVRLTVTHENVPDPGTFAGISHGWSGVLANLKSLLETGEVLPQSPFDMNNPFE